MKIEEAKLYLEHTSKNDFNLEEWQKENRYQAIKVVLEELEKYKSIIKEVRDKINKDYWWNWDTDNDKIIREILEIINKVEGKK